MYNDEPLPPESNEWWQQQDQDAQYQQEVDPTGQAERQMFRDQCRSGLEDRISDVGIDELIALWSNKSSKGRGAAAAFLFGMQIASRTHYYDDFYQELLMLQDVLAEKVRLA